jgi:hypothetical protein
VTLASADNAGCALGPAWFKALVELAAAECPAARFSAVLDCGDEAGTVLAALRHGITRVRFSGPDAAAVRLADIASQYGAVLECHAVGDRLDLLDVPDPAAACRVWLSRDGVGDRAD